MAAPFQIYYGDSYMSCKLRMTMSHPKWLKTLRKILDCIQVYNYNMDEYGNVLVSGRTNTYVFMNKIGKASRCVELVWMQSGECSNCLIMPSITVPPPPPPINDFEEDEPYVHDYYPRGNDPYYAYGDYYGGGLGNRGGYGYGGGGYPPQLSWDHLLDSFMGTFPEW